LIALALQAPPSCITATTPGDHTFTCGVLRVDVHVPRVCAQPGCGLILEIHGDTGTGLLEDSHTNLRERGDSAGYILVAPSNPRRTWSPSEDAAIMSIVRQAMQRFRVDAKKVHIAGFSRGGFATWRLMCDNADVFASAAPAAAGAVRPGGSERTCFANGRVPARDVPIIFLVGRTDNQVSFASMASIRDAAIRHYGAGAPARLAGDARYTHARWTGSNGVVIETFEHSYETSKDGPWNFAGGHCFPGSKGDPKAPQYALPCVPPNGFVWGEEVMRFFVAHPMR
jgi:polyhydroxybutyrate depolymerase